MQRILINEYIYALQIHNTALEVTNMTTPELGKLFIRTNFKLNHFKERQCTTRVEIYKYNTHILYFQS
jgi:hypothetical protein